MKTEAPEIIVVADHSSPEPEALKRPDRRSFLQGAAAIVGVAGMVTLEPMLGSKQTQLSATDIGPETGSQRVSDSTAVRNAVVSAEAAVPIPLHPDNGDEALYPNKIGNYSKGLRADPNTGIVDSAAYSALISAIHSGTFSAFEALATNGHLGCPDPAQQRRLVNPLAGYAYDLEGTDSHQLRADPDLSTNVAIQPAPPFNSAQEAGEMVELYWMALLRDVDFSTYDSNPLAHAAAADLSNLSDFRGPKVGGVVTTGTLFRDNYPGCLTGPYVSQFLLQPAAFGAQLIDQRVGTVAPGDFMTNFSSWLNVQLGCNVPPLQVNENDRHYIHTGRDLTNLVHRDLTGFMEYLVATVILLDGHYLADAGNPYGQLVDNGIGQPLPAGFPGAKAQVGFATFGGPSHTTLMAEVTTRALKDIWYQKWLVHRRLRPETFGGWVEVQRLGRATFPFHPDLFRSTVLPQIFSKYGSYNLPQAFPEGSPMHTSYGSGHATLAGGSATMLKALFAESAVIQNPLMPNPSDGGQTLIPYTGPSLTVGGELNKLVSNVSQGRNIAGVHWRTDATESNKLGQSAAISVLKDMHNTYFEPFNGYSLTRFNGSTVTVG